MKFKFSYFFILFAGLAGTGCDIVNPSEVVPTYVRVDSFHVQPLDPAQTGKALHEVNSVWVYFNNNTVGVFDMPTNIPIITSGPGTVQLVPAIMQAGVGSVQQYPFYEPDTFSLSYEPGTVTHLAPKTRYRNNAKFRFEEGFERINTFEKVNPDLSGTLIRTDEDAASGSYSGVINLSSAANTSAAEVMTKEGFPVTRGEAYVELTYKCTVPFEIGMLTIVTGSGEFVYAPLNGFYATDTWKKAYVTIKDFVSTYQGNEYKLLIRATLPEDTKEGKVLIDNIKVISF